MLTPMTDTAWMKEEKEIHKKISELASSSKGFKSLNTDITRDEDPDVETKCKLSRRVFSETLDMYEDGEMTYDEFCEDFYKSCKAISKTKAADLKTDEMDEIEEVEED